MNHTNRITVGAGGPHIYSIDAEKAFNKIQYPFMIKTLSLFNKLGIEGNSLNMTKAIYLKKKSIANIILIALKDFLLRSGTRQESLISHFLLNEVLEVYPGQLGKKKK